MRSGFMTANAFCSGVPPDNEGVTPGQRITHQR